MLAPVGKTERPRDALTLGFWGIRQRRLTRARGRKLTRHDGNFVGNLVNFQVLRRGGVPRGDRRRGRRENSRGRARCSASVEKKTGDKESSARGVREATGRSKRAENARGSTTTHIRHLESLRAPNARSATLRKVAIRRCRLVENSVVVQESQRRDTPRGMRSRLFTRARRARLAMGRARNAPVDGNIQSGRLDRPGSELKRWSRRGLRVHHLSSHCPRRSRARKRFPFPLRSRKRRAERVSRFETLGGGGRARLQRVNGDEPASFRSSVARRRRRGGGDLGQPRCASTPFKRSKDTRGASNATRRARPVDFRSTRRLGGRYWTDQALRSARGRPFAISRCAGCVACAREDAREVDDEREECSNLARGVPTKTSNPPLDNSNFELQNDGLCVSTEKNAPETPNRWREREYQSILHDSVHTTENTS